MPANVKFAATRAVSLKALCNAVYVSATITLLGSLPLVLYLVHGRPVSSFRDAAPFISRFTILTYALVLVIFYKIRDRLDKKKDGPWLVFFAVGLLINVLSVFVNNPTSRHFAGFFGFMAMLGAIWMARKKLKEQEASGEDMPYYALVGSAPVSQVELAPVR